MLVSADDITFSSESLEFSPTMTSFTVTVTALTDNQVEGDETIDLTLFTTAMNVALPTVTINVIDLTGERGCIHVFMKYLLSCKHQILLVNCFLSKNIMS